MITCQQGDLLKRMSKRRSIQSTLGVAESGIALIARAHCLTHIRIPASGHKAGNARIGRIFITETGELAGPRWIINVPTKEQQRQPSHLEWIEDSLQNPVRVVHEDDTRSIALPPSGRGELSPAGLVAA